MMASVPGPTHPGMRPSRTHVRGCEDSSSAASDRTSPAMEHESVPNTQTLSVREMSTRTLIPSRTASKNS